MPTCTLCGQNAGLFRKIHPECERKNRDGLAEMTSLAVETALSGNGLDELRSRLEGMAGSFYVKTGELPSLIIRGFTGAALLALADRVLTEDEERNMLAYLNKFGLSPESEECKYGWQRLVMGATLRDLLEGKVPARVRVDGQLPFNFQKSEQLVWAFSNVRYLEDKAIRSYVGGYQGASFRVMKGVYYRTGSYRGHPIETTETSLIDIGWLAVTTKHLYFGGTKKSFRIPFKKVVSFEPFEDGLGVMRDLASAKPQRFITEDGWFVYNLVRNLAEMGL